MNRGRPPYNDVLTPREWEVLALVERGLINDEIAEQLGISATTAKYHVSQILSKIEVPNRRQAGAWRARRVPAIFTSGGLIKNAAWLAATAAVAAVIFIGLWLLVLEDSKTGTGALGKVAYVIDGDVWVKQLPNGPAKQLTNWGDVTGEPQWSASGDWLSVTREITRDQPTPPPGLLPGPSDSDDSTWIIDADGKRERQIESGSVGTAWSPVKDEFLFNAEYPNPQALMIEQADGTNRRVVLASDTSRYAPGQGYWTPSGEWIVLVVINQSTPDMPPTRALVRVRPDGTDELEFYRFEISECQKKAWVAKAGSCQLSPTAEGDERIPPGMAGVLTETQLIGVVGTPDEALLPLPANPIMLIPLDAANGVVTGGGVALESPALAYSPASGRLAAVRGSDTGLDAFLDWRIALMPNAGHLEYVTAPGEAADQPSWSPDGGTLFFTAIDASTDQQAPSADAINSRRIWSVDADGGNRKQLTDDPRYRDEYPLPTSDGTSILFTRIDLETEENPASLWLLELVTGKTTKVVDNFDQPQQLQNAWDLLLDWWQPSS